MPGVTHPEAGGQGDVLPTLGGASRAPGLPQAAAWRVCGRGPHPLLTRDVRQTQARGSQAGGHLCRGRVGPVCRFQSEDGGGAPVEGIWTAMGRV